jgi:hypothetical protein
MSAGESGGLRRVLFRSGGQKLFLGSLILASVVGSVGFSLVVFGAFSDFLSTTTDRFFVVGIGSGAIVAGSALAYAMLR